MPAYSRIVAVTGGNDTRAIESANKNYGHPAAGNYPAAAVCGFTDGADASIHAIFTNPIHTEKSFSKKIIEFGFDTYITALVLEKIMTRSRFIDSLY